MAHDKREQPPTSERTVGGWVWRANVHTMMLWLASFAGHNYDDLDAQAVNHGVGTSDSEQEHWYGYTLSGDRTLNVRLARDPNGSEVEVEVSGQMDAVLAARVETLVGVLADVEDVGEDMP